MKPACWTMLGLIALALPASATTVSGTVKVPAGKTPDDAVVYISSIPGKSFTPPAEPSVLDQKQKNFVPHVLVIQKGQKIVFPNTDIIRHNVYSPSKTHPFNLGIYPPGVKKVETFDVPGIVSLLCNVHPEMSAFVVVSETPYSAIVKADGSYEIKDVPPGKYEFIAWHEGLPEVHQTVEVKGATVAQNFSIKRAQ